MIAKYQPGKSAPGNGVGLHYQGSRAEGCQIAPLLAGGATETLDLELQLPPNRAEAVRYPEAFVARIRELAISHHDDDIIHLLNVEGHQSSTGRSLTLMIKWLRYKHRIPAPQPPDNTLNVRQVRNRYGVSYGSFTIGSAVVSSLRTSASQMHHTQYRLTTNLTKFLRTWVANSLHLRPSPQTHAA